MRELRRTGWALSWAALIALASVGCRGGGSDNVFGDLLEPLIPPTPGEAARDAFNVFDADKRRRAVALINASPFGGEDPYLRMYRLLLDDRDATVRAAVAAALGDHGTPEDADRLIPLLRDRDGFVRWQAARALQKLHNPDAIEPLIAVVTEDDDADARAAAAYALGQFDDPDAFDALVSALLDLDFGVVTNARDALTMMTGTDAGDDPADWLAWAEGRRGELFVDRLPYGYRPYVPAPAFGSRLAFWRKPAVVELREPVGLTSAEAGGASGGGSATP
ncbi:MAG: HEAT repeat domain-containing protein [Planctomycetota bacterium]